MESELVRMLCDADYREKMVLRGLTVAITVADLELLWEIKYKDEDK